MKKIVLLISLITFILGDTKSESSLFSDWKFGEVTPLGYVGIPIIEYSKTSGVVYQWFGEYNFSWDGFYEGDPAENTWADESYRVGENGARLADMSKFKITLPLSRIVSVYYQSSKTVKHPNFANEWSGSGADGKLFLDDDYTTTYEYKTYGITITADPSWFKK